MSLSRQLHSSNTNTGSIPSSAQPNVYYSPSTGTHGTRTALYDVRTSSDPFSSSNTAQLQQMPYVSSALIDRINSAKKTHTYHVNSVDLTLETTPRDSRYSYGLMELMKKEETLLVKDPSSYAAKSIVAKVDENLRLETRAFFAKMMNSNLKKWESLQEKLKKERDGLKTELLQQIRQTSATSGQGGAGDVSTMLAQAKSLSEALALLQQYTPNATDNSNNAAGGNGHGGMVAGSGAMAALSLTQHHHNPTSGISVTVSTPNRGTRGNNASTANNSSAVATGKPAKVVTAADLDAESERLECDYYKHWFRYEASHLDAAFRSQLTKIDVDWAAHEKTLKTEYDTKKSVYLGNSGHNSDGAKASSDAADNDGAGNRWQHPEKQKTLIHTAPVFTPSSHTMARPASSGIKRKETSSAASNALYAAEVERIEKEYQDALAALLRQKADAKRWLLRQQIRLNTQSEEVRKEKAFIGALMEEENRDFKQLQDTIRTLQKLQQAQSQSQHCGSNGSANHSPATNNIREP